MSHRHFNYRTGVKELIYHEMKMMSWFIPYLKKYGIESPGEEYFEEAKSQLESQLKKIKT